MFKAIRNIAQVWHLVIALVLKVRKCCSRALEWLLRDSGSTFTLVHMVNQMTLVGKENFVADSLSLSLLLCHFWRMIYTRVIHTDRQCHVTGHIQRYYSRACRQKLENHLQFTYRVDYKSNFVTSLHTKGLDNAD